MYLCLSEINKHVGIIVTKIDNNSLFDNSFYSLFVDSIITVRTTLWPSHQEIINK